jgi:hypothetical protein
MSRAIRCRTAVLAAAWIVLGLSAGAWAAAPPEVTIDLTLSKTAYEYNEPIAATVTVRNSSGGVIYISRGFSTLEYVLEMRVMDPAGRLLVATRPGVHNEFPDAPPLGWALVEGKPVRVAGCEALAAGFLETSGAEDLRSRYDISLPGWYSAQVQLSVRTFAGAPCEVEGYLWSGVLKSATRYFYVGGSSSGVKLTPDKWKASWPADSNVPAVEVQLMPTEGRSVEGYDPQSIRLNGLVPTEVKVLHPKIKAQFEARAALATLGAVQAGQTRRVLVSGKYNGQPFGVQCEVKIEK